ncbi:MAG: CPBP family intramembrane metalloprotease [Fibrobacteres bacterium]|nr:CPBP family intramembrane metalloprotease [Fibrobacterota bacterium]
MKQYRRTLYFLICTFGLSLLLVLLFNKSGGTWNTAGSMFMVSLYMFTPLISVLIVNKLAPEGKFSEAIGFKFTWNRWFVLAWLSPFAIAGAALLISLKMPGTSFSLGMENLLERYSKSATPEQMKALKDQMTSLPIHPAVISAFQALVAGLTINALMALGEEAGWRGFLHKELSHLGFINASLTTGIIWGIWHAPIIMMGHNYPDHPKSGVFLMIVFCMLFSPLLTFIRQRSGSVLAAAILHGTFNATAGLPFMLLNGGSDLTVGSMGAAGIIAMGIAMVPAILYGRRNQ